MAFNDANDLNATRFEKSLGVLTIKFVSLLKESEGGILDLKVAADALNVRQKRRIYDITNVLEGIGLIEKRNKNCIVWKGAVDGEDSQEASQRLKVLEYEVDMLEKHEKMLDQQKFWAQQSIKNIIDDTGNCHLLYVTDKDTCKCFDGQTLLAIQAPNGTQLEVPLPEKQASGSTKYQIHLKSENGQIYVLLVNKEVDSEPVVVQVPPPSEVSEAINNQTTSILQEPDRLTDTAVEDRVPNVDLSTASALVINRAANSASTFNSVPGEPANKISESQPSSIQIKTEVPLERKLDLDQLIPFTELKQERTLAQAQDRTLAQAQDSLQRTQGHLLHHNQSSDVPQLATHHHQHNQFGDQQPLHQSQPGKRNLHFGDEDPGGGEPKKRVQDMTMPQLGGMELPGLDDLISSEMWGPLLRLSPPPSEKDYCFNLDNSEGVCDLFDVI